MIQKIKYLIDKIQYVIFQKTHRVSIKGEYFKEYCYSILTLSLKEDKQIEEYENMIQNLQQQSGCDRMQAAAYFYDILNGMN